MRGFVPCTDVTFRALSGLPFLGPRSESPAARREDAVRAAAGLLPRRRRRRLLAGSRGAAGTRGARGTAHPIEAGMPRSRAGHVPLAAEAAHLRPVSARPSELRRATRRRE